MGDHVPRFEVQAAFVGGAALQDLRNLQPRPGVFLVEEQAEVGRRLLGQRQPAADAEVARVQLAEHQGNEGVQVFAARAVRDDRGVLRADVLPVGAVEVFVVEVVRKRAPRLGEHLGEFLVAVDGELARELHLRGFADGAAGAGEAAEAGPRVAEFAGAVEEVDRAGGLFRPLDAARRLVARRQPAEVLAVAADDPEVVAALQGAERDQSAVGRDAAPLRRGRTGPLDAQVDVVPFDFIRRLGSVHRRLLQAGDVHGEDVPAPLAHESDLVPAPSHVAVERGVPADVHRLGRTVNRCDVHLAGEAAVQAGVGHVFAVRRPIVIEHLLVRDEHLGLGAVGLHRPELASAQERDAIPLRRVTRAAFFFAGLRQLRRFELVGFGEFRVFGVVRFERIEFFVAGAIRGEEQLLPVGGPTHVVIGGGVFGEPRRLAPRGDFGEEQLAVDDDDRVQFVRRQGELGGVAVERRRPRGVRFVVGVDFDGQLPRRGGRLRARHPDVGAAFVHDPLAVAADPRPAHHVVGVLGDRLCGTAGDQPFDRLPHDVRAAFVEAGIGDVIEFLAVLAPHRGGVLPVVLGQLFRDGAIGGRQIEVIVAGTFVPAAVPRPRPAHECDLVAGRREVRLLRLEQVQLLLGPAFDRHGEGLLLARVAGAARAGEDDILPVRRPPGHDIVCRIEREPLRFAAHDGDDEDIVAAVPDAAESDLPAVRTEHGGVIVGFVHRHRPGDPADGFDDPDVPEVAEGDLFAVGGDVRRAREPDRLLPGRGSGDQREEQQSGEGKSGHGGIILNCGLLCDVSRLRASQATRLSSPGFAGEGPGVRFFLKQDPHPTLSRKAGRGSRNRLRGGTFALRTHLLA